MMLRTTIPLTRKGFNLLSISESKDARAVETLKSPDSFFRNGKAASLHPSIHPFIAPKPQLATPI